MAKKKNHNEWFRAVSRGNRKSCSNCSSRLDAGETIFSWGEYRNVKFRHIEDVCRACWPALAGRLAAHAGDCGCTITLQVNSPRPPWMVLPAVCVAVSHA